MAEVWGLGVGVSWGVAGRVLRERIDGGVLNVGGGLIWEVSGSCYGMGGSAH